MFTKISIAAAVTLLALSSSESFAATKKRPAHHRDTCGGYGCVGQNPDRVDNSCGGDPVSCYKRLKTHKKTSARQSSLNAGHLGAAHVRPTLEVIVTESPAHLRKAKDAESGLALIRPAA